MTSAPPAWDEDDPRDLPTISANVATLVRQFQLDAKLRATPTSDDVRSWHSQLYVGCAVPVPGYVGHFRGDADVAELLGYEVGVGPVLADGLPERVGVWSGDLASEIAAFFSRVAAALAQLDSVVIPGARPGTVEELAAIVELTAIVHGEWVRLHPFANGNGPTGRLWTTLLALRYALPIFVSVKPRPDDVAYQRAGRESMGRPPDFVGDHSTAVAVFGHLLSVALRTPYEVLVAPDTDPPPR